MQESLMKKMPLRRWGKAELTAFSWAALGLLSLYPVVVLLNGSFPIFTVIWLSVPIAAVIRNRNASQINFSALAPKKLLIYSAIDLLVLFALMLAFEPWSHTYHYLVSAALKGSPPDPTFAWIIRYPGLPGWIGMAIFSGLVTIFAEELFFRGWLLQWLLRRMIPFWAVLIQAVCFTLPQSLAALMLPSLQGVLYTTIYSFLAIGVVGGWIAARTHSIWPGLIGATLCNLVLTAIVLAGKPL